MTADFCDVGFNDSTQTIQTILIFVKIALSATDWEAQVFWIPTPDWEAKVFWIPTPDPHDCLLQLIKRDNGVMCLLQCIDDYRI